MASDYQGMYNGTNYTATSTHGLFDKSGDGSEVHFFNYQSSGDNQIAIFHSIDTYNYPDLDEDLQGDDKLIITADVGLNNAIDDKGVFVLLDANFNVLDFANITCANLSETQVTLEADEIGTGPYYVALVAQVNNPKLTTWHSTVFINNWHLTIQDEISTEEVYVDNNVFTYQPHYRYGFNGMERDDEMKGIGNSYDFGARLYDPRLGRWFSPDPLEGGFPGISTYNFSYNSPIVVMDPNGENGKVTINYESHTIVLSSTIYIYGPGASATVAQSLQQKADATFHVVEVQDANDPSVVWTVKVEVKYVYSETVEAAAENMGLTSINEVERNNGNRISNAKLGINPEDNVVFMPSGEPGRTHGKTTIGGNLSWAYGESALHEPFHGLGFDERYFKVANGEAGMEVAEFSGDFLSNSEFKDRFMDFHYVDISDFAIKLSQGNSGEYIYNNNTFSYESAGKFESVSPEDAAKGYENSIRSDAISDNKLIDNTGGGKMPMKGYNEAKTRVVND